MSDPSAFNTAAGELRLGPAPIDEALQTEAEHMLRDDMQEDGDIQPATPSGLTRPQPSDMPPLPPSFRTMDIKREVERVRDARKRIRLEPSLLPMDKDADSAQAAMARARALPSICAYTLYDVGDGYAIITCIVFILTDETVSAPCVTFSQDSSLMAVGFAESYIRLWNLKGEKLRGLKNDFDPNSIHDGEYRSATNIAMYLTRHQCLP